jgi:polysaccharide pyruvyl transferase WcaK-like protein
LSAELLHQIGLPPDEVHVTGDPAMVLDFPEKPHTAPIYQQIAAAKQQGKRLIGFSLRPVAVKYTLAPHRPGQASSSAWFLEEIAGLAKQVMDRLDAHVVFFSMHPEQDDFLGSQFADCIGAPDRLTLVPGNLSPQTMMAAIGLTDLFIGMRLHSLIFAARSSVPLIALAYDRKVEGFMQLLDQENRSLPPDQWAPARLLQLAIETWHQRAAIGGKIAARLPALQVDARRNVDILMKCLPESASHLSGDIG